MTKTQRYLLIALGVVLAVGLLGAFAGRSSSSETDPAVETPAPAQDQPDPAPAASPAQPAAESGMANGPGLETSPQGNDVNSDPVSQTPDKPVVISGIAAPGIPPAKTEIALSSPPNQQQPNTDDLNHIDPLGDNGPDDKDPAKIKPRGGDDTQPPPPSLIIIPPKDDDPDPKLPALQTATGKVQIVRAITDKSVHNTAFSVFYDVGPTIVHQDGFSMDWTITKPIPEADWLVWDLDTLTLSGRVPSSFAEGDSITITVLAVDASDLTDRAEYSFSITSLGPYNPEPLGCRATGPPIANEPWIKVGNWEWSEPNHNPAIPDSTPGYWQPNYVSSRDGIVRWYGPYIERMTPDSPSRPSTPQQETWRTKEVEYYRITRSPAWDWGPLIIDKDSAGSHDTTKVEISNLEGPDGHTEVDGYEVRIDGLWLYSLKDLDREAGASGYIYTIEASTCDDGPWSTPLELQWGLPNPVNLKPEFTYLTRYDEDGNLLPDNQLAVNTAWDFQRGLFYQVFYDLYEDGVARGGQARVHFHSVLPGAGHRVRFSDWTGRGTNRLIAGSGWTVKIYVRVACSCGGSGSSPNSEAITLSADKYFGPEVAND